MKIIYADGREVPRGAACTPDHYRSTYYVHHAREGTKDKIQQKFKVLWAKGEQFCIQHTFLNQKVVQEKIHQLTNQMVSHIETVCVAGVQ